MAPFSFLSFIALSVASTTVKALPLSPVWEEWSSWTPCTMPCGAGISSQNRSCLANCQGDKTMEKRYRSCCVQECPSSAASSENRCSKLPGRWIEATSNEIGCSVMCVNKTEDSIAPARREIQLASGTFCQTQEGREGICLDNICAVVGCDKVLGSGKRRNSCFQCSSSNAECQRVSDSRSIPLSSIARIAGKLSILNIPKKSSFLTISHPIGVNGTRLAIRSGGQLLFQGGRNGTIFQAAGSTFSYYLYSTTQGDREELRADGPTNGNVLFQLLFTTSLSTANTEDQLQYSYYQLNNELTSPPDYSNSSAHAHCLSESLAPVDRDFVWGYEESSTCSVTCGRGTKTILPRCIDKFYPKRTIIDLLCLQRGLVKPPPIVQICHNQDCLPMWTTGKWSSCSGECGEATQARPVQCERFVQEGSAPMTLTNQAACGMDDKPAVQQSCNRTDCRYNWVTGDWSMCSERITKNLQYRSVNCQQVGTKSTVDLSLCDASTRPSSVRNCRSKNCTGGRCCAWRPQSWEKCNTGCGVGQQSRVLDCRYTDDLSAADKSCCASVVQPPTQRQCWSTDNSNCSAFWDEGEFGKCKGRCCSSNQFKTRTVKCTAQPQPGETVVLPEEACSTIPKPTTSATCQRTDCPRWEVSEWGSCIASPNPPICRVRTRSVRCMLGGEEVTGCCEEPPYEVEPCLPCNPTTEPPPVCEGADVVSTAACEKRVDLCGEDSFRIFCCQTCNKHFS